MKLQYISSQSTSSNYFSLGINVLSYSSGGYIHSISGSTANAISLLCHSAGGSPVTATQWVGGSTNVFFFFFPCQLYDIRVTKWNLPALSKWFSCQFDWEIYQYLLAGNTMHLLHCTAQYGKSVSALFWKSKVPPPHFLRHQHSMWHPTMWSLYHVQPTTSTVHTSTRTPPPPNQTVWLGVKLVTSPGSQMHCSQMHPSILNFAQSSVCRSSYTTSSELGGRGGAQFYLFNKSTRESTLCSPSSLPHPQHKSETTAVVGTDWRGALTDRCNLLEATWGQQVPVPSDVLLQTTAAGTSKCVFHMWKWTELSAKNLDDFQVLTSHVTSVHTLRITANNTEEKWFTSPASEHRCFSNPTISPEASWVVLLHTGTSTESDWPACCPLTWQCSPSLEQQRSGSFGKDM